MNTGVTSFASPGELGPLYPFPGTEVPLAIIGIVLWIAWHVLHHRGETREMEEGSELFDQVGIDRILYHGSAGRVATPEEVRIARPPTPLVGPPDRTTSPPAAGSGAPSDV
jgi:hypothetical protein